MDRNCDVLDQHFQKNRKILVFFPVLAIVASLMICDTGVLRSSDMHMQL